MELYIPPPRPTRSPATGRFLPGHVPPNKGKKWSEYLSKRKQKRCAKGWKNLDKYRPKGNPNGGRPKKQVIAVTDDGKWRCFRYLKAAADWVGGNRENVGRCCRLNQERHINRKTGRVNTDHQYLGVRFYFETDTIWMKKINEGNYGRDKE